MSQGVRNVLFDRRSRGGGIPILDEFIIRVKSDNAGTSASNQFTIPVAAGTYLYDYTTTDGQSGTGITGSTTITFASGAGTYDISITGAFPKINFNNGGDAPKLLKVLQWGRYGEGNIIAQTNAFRGCVNCDEIAEDVAILNTFTDASGFLQSCNLSSLPSGLNFNNIIDGSSLLRDNNLTTLPSGMLFTSLVVGSSLLNGNSLTSLPSGMVLDNLENGAALLFNQSITDLPSGMTLPNLSNGTNMFFGNTINTTRYSQLLVDLESGNANNSVTFHGGNSEYNATGETARDILTGGVRLWTITDGGLE